MNFKLGIFFLKNTVCLELYFSDRFISLLGPIFIQEQNSIPGSTNRLLAKYKKIEKIFCGFPEALDFFEEKKAIFSGNLINLDVQKVRHKSFCQNELKIKIMGGSLGAKLINTTMPKVFSKLSQNFPNLNFCVTSMWRET